MPTAQGAHWLVDSLRAGCGAMEASAWGCLVRLCSLGEGRCSLFPGTVLRVPEVRVTGMAVVHTILTHLVGGLAPACPCASEVLERLFQVKMMPQT